MAIPLAVPVVAIIAILAATSGGSSTSSGGGGGGGDSFDLNDCTKAILGLPNTKGPGGSPSIQEMVNVAMIATTMSQADYESMAASLDTLAAASKDPVLTSNARLAARCLRERGKTAKGGAVGGGPPVDPTTLTCEDAIKLLPADLQKQIIAARTANSAAMLSGVADTLDGLALIEKDPTTKTRMQLTAKCLRTVGGGDVGVGKDGGGKKGIASGPAAVWLQRVVAGDYAGKITEQVFGTGTTTARVNELINANNPKDFDGLNLGPVRSDWGTSPPPGQANGVLNWTRLPAGAHLRIPAAWNPWIDQQGNRAHGPTPFPVG
jgi:hypothetical protein